METYKIEIEETLSKIIEIEAESESDAILKIRELYFSEDIILTENEFVNVEFKKIV